MLKLGRWDKKTFSTCKGLHGKVLGLIGFGKVGQRVCRLAKALEMEVKVFTRSIIADLDKEMGFHYATLEELLSTADFVSLHVPLNDLTTGMVDEYFLG
jgi:phosphoglycerate dehydrogenase-like enzyme